MTRTQAELDSFFFAQPNHSDLLNDMAYFIKDYVLADPTADHLSNEKWLYKVLKKLISIKQEFDAQALAEINRQANLPGPLSWEGVQPIKLPWAIEGPRDAIIDYPTIARKAWVAWLEQIRSLVDLD